MTEPVTPAAPAPAATRGSTSRGWCWLAMGLWSLAAGGLAWRFRGQALDDFYITYRYALNLAGGHGFEFNPGERVFALTNPGLGLLLALLRTATGAAVPDLATGVWAVALVAVAGLALGAARRAGCLPEGLAGGTLAVTASFLWVLHGGEGMPMLALLLLAARWGGERPVAAGLCAGAAAWFRPEAAVGAALLALLLWRERRRLPWRFAAAVALMIAGGIVLAWLYFGTPLPNSLAAKRALAAGRSGLGFWPAAVRLVPRHAGRLWPVVTAAGLAGMWPLLRAGDRTLRLLALFALSLAVLYPILGVAFAAWYTLPVVTGLLYGIAFLGGALARRAAAVLPRSRAAAQPAALPVPPGTATKGGMPGGAADRGMPDRPPRAAAASGGWFSAAGGGWLSAAIRRWPSAAIGGWPSTAMLGLLAVVVGWSLVPAEVRWLGRFGWPPYMERYRQAGEWLGGHAAAGASVSYYEVGALGYHCRCTVIDLVGVVTPDLLPYVRRGDFGAAFLARPGDYAIGDRGRGGWMPIGAPWFQRAYQPVATFGEHGELTVYARQPGVPLPRPPRSGPPEPP
jgi:hypothetical protein